MMSKKKMSKQQKCRKKNVEQKKCRKSPKNHPQTPLYRTRKKRADARLFFAGPESMPEVMKRMLVVAGRILMENVKEFLPTRLAEEHDEDEHDHHHGQPEAQAGRGSTVF
jgi:hypothetical protein